jgi:ankyrin repeat protein
MSRKKLRIIEEETKIPDDINFLITSFITSNMEERVTGYGEFPELFEDVDADELIYYAVRYNNARLIEMALRNGASVNTGLGSAILSGNIDLIKFFLEKGATVNLKQLSLAINVNNLETIKLLLPMIEEQFPKRTVNWALVYSAALGNEELVNFFIQQGADILNDAFLESAVSNNLAIMRLLISQGAQPNLEYTTRLVITSMEDNYDQEQLLDVLRYLLELGADPEYGLLIVAEEFEPDNFQPFIDLFISAGATNIDEAIFFASRQDLVNYLGAL